MPDGLQGRSFDDRSNSSSTPQLEVLARQSAVLTVFENAHWIAPTSLEVFSRAVQGIEQQLPGSSAGTTPPQIQKR
jgi:hypothetical protein